MQTPEPQKEHLWLQRLVGEWEIQSECSMGPDQPPVKSNGSESVRALGRLWIIGEGRFIGEGSTDMPDGSCDTIVTLGFDLQTKCFVGTFIAAAMTHLWPYNGTLDASGQVLKLDSNGPSFAGDGTMVKYQDIIEFVTDDHRVLSSQVLDADGQWRPVMKAHYRRKT